MANDKTPKSTVTYGNTTCKKCNKKVSLKDTLWVDHLQWHVCNECRKDN